MIDLSVVRSPDSVNRALSDYGPALVDPTYHMFCKLLAEGKPASRPYMALWPDASEDNARKQASVLTAHPDIPGMVRDQLAGGRQLVEALVPQAVRDLHRESTEATKETKPRIDALNSILDRGGLPRAKQLAVTVGIQAHEAMAAFDDVEVIEVEALEVSDQVHPSMLPAQGRRALPLPSASAPDELDADRAEWASLLPVEALRTIESVATLDAAEIADDEADSEQPEGSEPTE